MIQHDDTSDLFTARAAAQQQTANGSAPVHEIRMESPAGGSGDSIGARLHAARLAQGLGLAECARRLHLPAKVLERLEAGDFGTPDHFVFLRGALKGYASLLGLPADACNPALRAAAPTMQPALTSVARVSHMRWLLQRYGTAATYIVLTATIAVPLVLLGLRGGLEQPSARIVSLDQAPQSATSGGQVSTTPDATPFRASMTPFSAIGLGNALEAPHAVAITPAPVPAAVAGQHTLSLSATGDCWFEITRADGTSVDSGMLHAGDSRSWHANGELHVTLGNANGVSVQSDGQPLALDAYRHASVARFDVFGPSGSSVNN